MRRFGNPWTRIRPGKGSRFWGPNGGADRDSANQGPSNAGAGSINRRLAGLQRRENGNGRSGDETRFLLRPGFPAGDPPVKTTAGTGKGKVRFTRVARKFQEPNGKGKIRAGSGPRKEETGEGMKSEREGRGKSVEAFRRRNEILAANAFSRKGKSERRRAARADRDGVRDRKAAAAFNSDSSCAIVCLGEEKEEFMSAGRGGMQRNGSDRGGVEWGCCTATGQRQERTGSGQCRWWR
jgi:hypothetical protein